MQQPMDIIPYLGSYNLFAIDHWVCSQKFTLSVIAVSKNIFSRDSNFVGCDFSALKPPAAIESNCLLICWSPMYINIRYVTHFYCLHWWLNKQKKKKRVHVKYSNIYRSSVIDEEWDCCYQEHNSPVLGKRHLEIDCSNVDRL